MKDSARHPASTHGDGVLMGCMSGSPTARPSRTPLLKTPHAVAEGNLLPVHRAFPLTDCLPPLQGSRYQPADERDVAIRKKAN